METDPRDQIARLESLSLSERAAALQDLIDALERELERASSNTERSSGNQD